MLNKFRHKLGFLATRRTGNNSRERVTKTLVDLSQIKRTPTQTKGFIAK